MTISGFLRLIDVGFVLHKKYTPSCPKSSGEFDYWIINVAYLREVGNTREIQITRHTLYHVHSFILGLLEMPAGRLDLQTCRAEN